MKRTKSLSILIILILISIRLQAQSFVFEKEIKITETDSRQLLFSIEGRVVEQKSNNPISYASISIKNKVIGTVTNSDGFFVLHIPANYKNDSLVVSSLGYKSFSIKINEILGNKLNIQLEKKIYDIAEVVVKSKNAMEIILEAISKMAKNFTSECINMDGFYREMTFENDTCVQMAEAACEIYYRPYGEEYSKDEASQQKYSFSENNSDYFYTLFDYGLNINPKDKVKIIEARASNLLHKKRFKLVPRGGIVSCVKYDFAKNRFILGERALRKAEYKLVDITTYNNREVYVISYEFNNGRYNKGFIYFDIKTMAVVAFKVQTLNSKIRRETTKYWTPALYSKKRKKCTDYQELKSEVIIVNYKEVNGKWYLNNIRKELEFDYIFSKFYIHQKEQPKISYRINRELLINRIDTTGSLSLSDTKTFSNSYYNVLYDYDLNYDSSFWENYNSIQTTPLQDSILQQLELYRPIEKQFLEKYVLDTSLIQPNAEIINEINPYTNLKDEYYWMQDIKDSKVLKYIEAENKYTDNYMLPLKLIKRNIYQEQIKRIEIDTVSIRNKTLNNDYKYYFREVENENYENIYRKSLFDNSPEELIVDTKEKAKSNTNFFIDEFSINPSNTFIVYAENYGIGYESTMIVKNITNKKDIDTLENITNIIWTKKQDVFYYTEWNQTNSENKVYKHIIGNNREADKLIYEEKNPLNEVSVMLLNDKQHCIVESSNDYYDNELYLLDLSSENEELQLIAHRKNQTNYKATIINDTLYSLTVRDSGKYILSYSPIDKPHQSNWRKLILNKPGIVFEGYLILKNYIVIEERQNMLSGICVYKKSGELVKTLKFKEETYSVNLSGNNDLQNKNIFRYAYSSLKTPQIIYEYDIHKLEQKIVKQGKIKGYDQDDYITKLIWATSNDGTKIPISLVYNKKEAKRNGKSPLYLTAYGSYGASTDPDFASDRLSLIDRGIIYAIAHVRGGSELGEDWHEQAMQLKKKNTFNDFIACAEYLIDKKYSSKGKIVAEGGSAGGLIMGVVANQRPDLFNTVILQVAFLDVLGALMDSTAKFSSVSKGEKGDPANPEVYNYIKSYSPYQNIKTRNYPTMLFYIGLNDNRVEYWQSLKSVAKLRALKTDNNKLYLKTELYAGHNGYMGEHAYFAWKAFTYAFILGNLGIKY